MSDSRNFQAFTREAFGEIITGCVPFDIRAQRDHDFLDRLVREPPFEVSDAQVIRLDAVEGRDFASQHMELAAKSAGLFNANDIHWTLDHAEQTSLAARV